MSEIAVLGPGGVGGFLAAALTRAGERVTIVAREPTAEVIRRKGIQVESVRLGDFSVRPSVTSALAEDVDILFVTTKAPTLPGALERVQSEPHVIVPLLNGLDHVGVLRDWFGAERVVAAVIRIESISPSPGHVVQTSPFLRVDLAADDPGLQSGLRDVAATLERAGIPAHIDTSEAQALWSKLVRLSALALATSATGETIGFIRSDPVWRQRLIALIAEATAVANAEGAQIETAATLAELDDAHPGLGSSMQRDLRAGREPELDAIAGAVLRAGRRHGIDCPTIEQLSQQITETAGLAHPRV